MSATGSGLPAVAPPSGWPRRLDPRAKLLLLLSACLVCQYLPAAWLPLWLVGLAGLFLIRDMRRANVLAMLRGAIVFTAFWLLMKVGTDMVWDGLPLMTALTGSLPLCGRLAALALIGVAFVGLSSPMETGRAAAWFIRPFAGANAWKPALVVAFTAWFLPLTLRLAADVNAGIRARGLRLSWRKKAFLLVGTSLRILEHKAAELAVGLASRRLDDRRSWTMGDSTRDWESGNPPKRKQETEE